MRALRLALPGLAVLMGLAAPAAGAAVRQADWAFGGIGGSERTVRIVVPAGTACGDSLAPPIVQETAWSVRITAFIATPEVTDPRPCPLLLELAPQFVTLEAPLAGRALLGTDLRQGGPRRVTRVVGLAPGDAISVLRARGLEPKVVRRRTSPGLRRVTGQRGARLAIGGGLTRTGVLPKS